MGADSVTMAESWWQRTRKTPRRISATSGPKPPRPRTVPDAISADLSKRARGKTTILTWLWDQPGGIARYTAEHVNIWAAMLRRNITVPHRLVCVTDIPEGINDCVEVVPLPWFPRVDNPHWPEHLGKPQCYRRLDMYRKGAEDTYGKRTLMLDLDVVIAQNIDDIVTYAGDVMFMRSQSGDRMYNGSLQFVKAGKRAKVFDEFSVENAQKASKRYVGSDQAWLHDALGVYEPTIGDEHGVYFYRRRMKQVPENARVLFFPGAVKPWHLDKHGLKWVQTHYRGES
jgi:hypothetical protein